MEIKEKTEPTEEEITGEKTISDRIELLKFITEVQTTVKDTITSDYILAKLNKEDKELIREMTVNAYFSKRLQRMILIKSKPWYWNKINRKWEKRQLTNWEKEKISKHEIDIFNSFMTRLHMTALLNRNISGNYLIDVLTGKPQIPEETLEEPQTVSEKIKRRPSKNEEQQ